MRKEEKIQEVLRLLSTFANQDGWIDSDLISMRNPNDFDFDSFYTKNDVARPKELRGIENNNGWIKIESEDDLPEDKDNSYFVKTIYSKEILERDYPIFTKSMSIEEERKWWLKNITHYQPIIKPQPPIY